MVLDIYTEKIVELVELGVPVADTRTEVKKILKEFYQHESVERLKQTLKELDEEGSDVYTKIGGTI